MAQVIVAPIIRGPQDYAAQSMFNQRLVHALSGGLDYINLAPQGVRTQNIRAGAVTTDLLAAGAVTAGKITVNALDSSGNLVPNHAIVQINAGTTTIEGGRVVVTGTGRTLDIVDGNVTTAQAAADAAQGTANTAGADALDAQLKIAYWADANDTTLIDGAKIYTGSVTAVQLKADAIDGKTITGATVRTAASGKRIELNATDMRVYDNGGYVRVGLLTETDEARLTFYDSLGNRQGWINGYASGGSEFLNIGSEYGINISGPWINLESTNVQIGGTGINSLFAALGHNHSGTYSPVGHSHTVGIGGAHNHGIPDGTVLMVNGGGTVTWVANTGHSDHSVS